MSCIDHLLSYLLHVAPVRLGPFASEIGCAAGVRCWCRAPIHASDTTGKLLCYVRRPSSADCRAIILVDVLEEDPRHGLGVHGAPQVAGVLLQDKKEMSVDFMILIAQVQGAAMAESGMHVLPCCFQVKE